MSEINILIVEDDKRQQSSYIDSIKFFNEKNGHQIKYLFKDNVEEAEKLLSSNSFDAAIVDVKLGGTDTTGKGNEIIKMIKDKLRFPVYVVTGNVGDIEPDLLTTNIFFKIYERDKIAHSDLFTEIENLFKTGLTNILGGRGIVDGYLTRIFWDNLSSSVEDFFESPNPEKSLLRYTMTHLLEYLEIDESGLYEQYHLNEVYISPNINKQIKTGCIIENKTDKLHYIVLTPSCDLAQDKAKYIVVSEVGELNAGIISEKINILKGGNEDLKVEAKNILEKVCHNNYSNKYYFLPKAKKYKGGLINFQKLEFIKKCDIMGNYDIILNISHQFVKDIIVKLSNYYSRQGSPDLDTSKIISELLN